MKHDEQLARMERRQRRNLRASYAATNGWPATWAVEPAQLRVIAIQAQPTATNAECRNLGVSLATEAQRAEERWMMFYDWNGQAQL